MYWKLLTSSLERKLGGRGPRGRLRSGTVTGVIIGVLVLGAAVAYVESGRGHIHRIKTHLKRELETPPPVDNSAPRPGGLDAVILSRTLTPGAAKPEFLSATILPGRGMNILQIAAFLPGRGEVNLLASPSLRDANRAMSGVEDDSEGEASLLNGAPILYPWAGKISGITSVDGRSVSVTWRGTVLDLPANSVEGSAPIAFGGLLLKEPSSTIKSEKTADGGTATAVFASNDMDDRWPSKGEVTIAVALSGKSMEMTVDAKNTGDEVMPVGIGWAPRFLVVGGDRGRMLLHVPATENSEARDTKTGIPSGRLTPVAGTRLDFLARGGVALGARALGDTLFHLKQGPEAAIELRDPVAKYGLRITPVSQTIKAVHLYSPENANYVSISPQMNYDDPFGRQWPDAEDTGMVMVQSGQTVEWKIRLEIFALAD